MKLILLLYSICAIFFILPNPTLAQAPDLGAASSFAVFTGVGQFTNDGATLVTGDIGTDAGAFSGFPPGVVIGEIHVADAESAAAAIAVNDAYGDLAGTTCGQTIGTTLGNGQILTPDIYCTGAATTLNGELILDAENDPDALFIFLIDGALSTSVFSTVTLINGATPCNVWWQINGAFSLGDGSVFRGNALVEGAISLLEGSSLYGRALATSGAIDLHNNLVSIALEPMAPVISADGPTTFCMGDSVILSGNETGVWNTGDTTASITVFTSGDFYVIDSNSCGTDTSNIIQTTVNPLPDCTITGDTSICEGQSTVLCAPAGAASYLWSTNETTNCITITAAGNYSVTVTDTNGCSSMCSATVTMDSLALCSITGDTSICEGQSTELCAPTGAASYLWSTGETTNCITASAAGNYSVTVTDTNGCSNTCSATVTMDSLALCSITGDTSICEGESTELCVPPGAESYLWSTGDTTNCITVTAAGDYSVTFTSVDGCTSTCSTTVTVNPIPVCTITGNNTICEGEATELCAPAGMASYLWSTGETTNCITVTATGNYAVTITDANGCSSNCNLDVVSNDATPIITCPTDVTIACDESSLPTNTGTATATNDCGLSMTITYADAVAPGLCPQESEITRTWTATTSSGDSSSCIQLITIIDTIIPVIICPADIAIGCDESTLPTNTGFATATDNCDLSPVVSYTDTLIPGTCLEEYLIVRTWSATDSCGNAASCQQMITVSNNTPPVITIIDPLLAEIGDTTLIQCYGQDPNWDLPQFDENSVEAISLCGGNVTVDYNQTLVDEGDCEADGYSLLYQLTWTATDLCGNSSSAFIMLAMVDTIAPVIHGVPADTTVNCDAIPNLPTLVYATDECLCACVVVVQESLLPTACLNGQVLLRTWTASDRCGNETVVTQRITIVDDEGPGLSIIDAELAGMPDGTLLEYTCNEGGFPEFLDGMNAESIITSGTCGSTDLVTFSVETSENSDCATSGFVEERTYQWIAEDACGNTSTFSIVARLIDDEAPVLMGIPEGISCIGNPDLEDIYALDNCAQEAFPYFFDVSVENPCGPGTAIQRTYEVIDVCGNIARDTVLLIPNDQTAPILEFVNPEMANHPANEIMIVNCAINDGQYTSYSAADVSFLGACGLEVHTTFTERLIETRDCVEGEAFAIVELQWITTDICGNSAVLTRIAHVMDESGPAFVNFQPEMTIACHDALPTYTTTDNCSEATVTTLDSIIEGDCELIYDIHRLVTATDLCGNSTSRIQLIHVGNSDGPVINGVEEEVCDDLSMPDVTAFDACSGEFVPVSMEQDTLDVPCRDGLVLQRTWTAVDVCGNVSVIVQTITMNDETPPVISIPNSSFINYTKENEHILIFHSQPDLLNKIDFLDANSVIVTDECDQDITPVLTVDVHSGDCIEDGFSERRVYTWVATDNCGNSSSLTVTVDIIDDKAPEMRVIPSDTVLVCVELPAATDMLLDTLEGETIVFTEVIEEGGNVNEFIVTRTWVATDSCGNTNTFIQRIVWIPESQVACEIIFPEVIECNSHGVIIGSMVTGGNSSDTYEWEVVGENCFIQGGQGTPEIEIYIGWEDAKVILTVTDTFGCVSMCMVSLHCDLRGNSKSNSPDEGTSYQRSPKKLGSVLDMHSAFEDGETLAQLKTWPNPATESITLSFASAMDQEVQFTLMNTLGQTVINEHIQASRGFNTDKVNLNHLSPGTYHIQVNTGRELHSSLLIIQRAN